MTPETYLPSTPSGIAPVAVQERHLTVDVLRGFAVLGILLRRFRKTVAQSAEIAPPVSELIEDIARLATHRVARRLLSNKKRTHHAAQSRQIALPLRNQKEKPL